MRADFERYYREEHAADSDYDAVEIYGTYAKTTPENDVYPAHTMYNPADVVHPVRPLNEISREELLDIVSNGPSSKRSSKQVSPGHSHVITANSSFKFEGMAATAQVRPVLEARTRQLEEDNQRLLTKVKILEDNCIREREEWMPKYFDHIRECKARKNDPDRLKGDLQKERDGCERLQRELVKARGEVAAMKRESEERELDWECTVKDLKRHLASEKLKNQEDMVAIRYEFTRIQSELDRVRTRKTTENKCKSVEIDSEMTRKMMEKDREIRNLQIEMGELREKLGKKEGEVEILKKELRQLCGERRDRQERGETTRRSLSTRKQAADRDTTPARESTRLLATKKGRSFSGTNGQSRSNKELKRPGKTTVRADELNESIVRMEARIARHRERYLSCLHSQSHSKEDLAHLSESLNQDEDRLAQLRNVQDELHRSKR